MRRIFVSVLVLMFFPLIVFAQQNDGDVVRVFYLGGQSNMDGYGYNRDLPGNLNKTFKNVWIFHGNSVPDDQVNGGLGKWAPLQSGHGTGFTSDGANNSYSERFGLELSFAQRLQDLFPGEKIALIKYSRGGTSIDSLAAGEFGSWEPDYRGTTGVNQYDHFLTTVRQAMAAGDIDGDGKKDILLPAGIVWMQGESDAGYTEAIAMGYYANLKRLMDLIRAAFRVDDLPVVLGKISDSWNDASGKVWQYGELVQFAQEKYTRTDGHAAIVRSTRYYQYSDPWHYDSKGYIDLGEKMADAMYQLVKEKR